MQKIISNIIIIILLFSSCSNNYRHEKEIVENLVGEKVILPEGLKIQIIDTPFEYDFNDADYKIVTYIDSMGCTSCNMKLTKWNDTIDEFKSLENIDINFLMIISSKNLDEMLPILNAANFKHPIIIDTEGEFNKFNNIPKETSYQTFLLDSNNQILALGNPVINPKIKELFKKIISGIDVKAREDNISLVKKPVRNVGLINKGDSVIQSFYLFNKDLESYHIQDIIPSCDCVIVECDSFVLVPREKSHIRIKVDTDSVGTTFSKYVDIFYEEKEKPERLFVYGYLR